MDHHWSIGVVVGAADRGEVDGMCRLPPMEVYYFGGYESHEPSARKDAAVEQLDVRH